MDYEEKLLKYRAQKRRAEMINKAKDSVLKVFTKKKLDEDALPLQPNSDEEDIQGNHVVEEETSTVSSDAESEDETVPFTYKRTVKYLLVFGVWASLYAFFIKIEFGIVYLIVSGVVGMYINTRTRPKRKNEPSAYSVFNKNCESIDGALKAEQLQREMMFGGFV